MDDDVKNLFQKFGQNNQAYREINRDLESDQARERWPLLRDVQVSTQPDTAPVPLDEDKPMPLLRPTSVPTRKPALKDGITGISSEQVATPAAPDFAADPGAKLSQPAANTIFTAPASAFNPFAGGAAAPVNQGASEFVASTAKPEPVAPAPAAPAVARSERASLFGQTAQNSAPVSIFSHKEQAAAASQFSQNTQKTTTQPLFGQREQKPAMQVFAQAAQPAATAAPRSASSSSLDVPNLFHNRQEQAAEAAGGADKSVSAVFNRLARKEEAAQPPATGTQSFFKRIFRS